MNPVIELQRVTKRHGPLVRLAEIDLTIKEGEMLALLGHNGAGKTTIMKLILGLIAPSSGHVDVLGGAPDGPHAERLRRQLGYLPENVTFYEQLTGREVLTYFARLKRADRHQVTVLLERVGLVEAADRRVKTYSKGMRQRLGLAQALLGSPRLLLLDEPTTGLDPAATRDFYQAVKALRDNGCTVLLSSHVLPGIEPYIDRALILGKGRRLALGSLEQLREEAKLPLTFRIHGTLLTMQSQLWKAMSLEPIPINERCVEVNVPAENKMQVLRQLTTMPNIDDIELSPPTLEHLYTHFSTRPASLTPGASA
ncbi:ABC transporter ATP-binding protein [Halomonas sp. QX-2]|jgi:Cu-processing system ATP-binding protein|uniref:ABC transporter ATP-binding protein n=1 Tax=Vreelandella sedimenti TaxID=2729618 RepID=A0A7Z0N8A2_9GAMM|nr:MULTISPECIES: ABC transporter ATP-binding protein [Halomonas]NYT72766.1 ABC transporter ATP-binding protein [Halomonas sedimenti]|tara:strand:+ start:29468 stop:30400 length:933 start_codon:yes stop_codon:yes gene_type:complete